METSFSQKAQKGLKKVLDNVTIEPMIVIFNFSDALDQV